LAGVKQFLYALTLTASAALAQPLPVLQFEPPKGFTGSLGKDPSAHVSMNGDAIINVYPFRRLDGKFEDQFRRTRLRELLQPDSQEAQLAGQAEIQPIPVPGAQAALAAKFVENRFGQARHRLRLAIYSGGAVAIVDYNAAGPEGYQRNWPALAGVLDSLRIGSAQTAAEPAPKAGSTGGVDGLYLASTRRFVMRIGGPPGSGDWQIATRFYLLSPDGRFHRGYDLPAAPGGNIRAFDYARAEREDAANTGSFSVKGGRVQLRARSGDVVEGQVAGGELKVDNMTFKKAALKK
jgi:hypothetical protein